jgi:pimeloyl-ACP methyl ester carboxylesterase
MVPKRQAGQLRLIRNALPHAVVEVWAGSGHFPHLAHPARFAERLAATA